MRLGIMQPYFCPYLGYFALIAATDRWIVFDTPQYIRKGWVNRNRVLKLGRKEGDWKYVRIPVAKSKRESPIYEIRVDPHQDWKQSILDNLDFYRVVSAPFYDETLKLLQLCFALGDPLLSPNLVHFLKCVCEYVGLKFEYQVLSQMRIELPAATHPGQWALRLCEVLGASHYINPPAGREIFDRTEFSASNIQLSFLVHNLPRYDQKIEAFVAGLSIIDVLMFNSPEDVLAMVHDYVITDS
jgi:hypothetical protein